MSAQRPAAMNEQPAHELLGPRRKHCERLGGHVWKAALRHSHSLLVVDALPVNVPVWIIITWLRWLEIDITGIARGIVVNVARLIA